VFFDPQYRGVLDKWKYGNEGARQRGRFDLRAMTSDYIDVCCREVARVLTPSGYLLRWTDTFHLCEGDHRRIGELKCVDLIAWDSVPGGAATISWCCRNSRWPRRAPGGIMRFRTAGRKRWCAQHTRTPSQSALSAA
jgi:hypothetical protein